MAARARRLTLTRRGVLAAAGAAALAGCAPDQGPTAGARRIRYGDDHESQFADLRVPAGSTRATVVLLHGGYWLPPSGLELMTPMAEQLTARGFATWNVEYRLTGDGGGYPHTLADVAAAVDRLAGDDLPPALSASVVVVGHSAGGQLAVWAASRTSATPGGAAAVVPRHAVSLAGLLDLTLAAGRPGSRGPVTAYLGGTPAEVPQHYALADPALLVPAACPVTVVVADADGVVPDEQGRSYLGHARRAGVRGRRVGLVEVPGDHMSVIDTDSAAFATVVGASAGVG